MREVRLMGSLGQWGRDLKKLVEDAKPDEGASSMRRVLAPGLEPLHFEGFVRFAGIQPIYRVGNPPETMSVVVWGDKKSVESMGYNDFPANLGAGLSFVCDRRIEVLNELHLSQQDEPNKHTFISLAEEADRRLVSPVLVKNIPGEFKKLVEKMASLQGKDEVVIGSALDLHYGAVLLYDRDLATAYTLLVAGIETLSRRYGSPPEEWSFWDKSHDWDAFIEKNSLDEGQANALRRQLMKDQHLRLKETFVEYVVRRLPKSFWDQEWKEYLYTVDLASSGWTEGSWQQKKKIRELLPEDQDILRGCDSQKL